MILILSEGKDMSMNLIVRWLRYYGADFVRVTEASKVCFEHLEVNNQHPNISININGQKVIIDSDTVVYIRRGTFRLSNLDTEPENPLKHYLQSEGQALEDYLYYFAETKSKYCLGSVRKAGLNKLEQLEKAAEIGLKIADTLITTRGKAISGKEKLYITKPIQDIFIGESGGYGTDSNGAGYVLRTEEENLPFPSLLQKKIGKNIELRVFFFENNYYALAKMPYHARMAKHPDWRVYNAQYDKMRYFPCRLAPKLKQQLRALSKKLDINTGSYDILFDGQDYYFLEVNTHGQFGYVSTIGNYYIERDIAKHLYLKSVAL